MVGQTNNLASVTGKELRGMIFADALIYRHEVKATICTKKEDVDYRALQQEQRRPAEKCEVSRSNLVCVV